MLCINTHFNTTPLFILFLLFCSVWHTDMNKDAFSSTVQKQSQTDEISESSGTKPLNIQFKTSRNLIVFHPEQPKMMSIFEDLSWLRVGGVYVTHQRVTETSWPHFGEFSRRPPLYTVNNWACSLPDQTAASVGDQGESATLFFEEKTSLWLHRQERGYLLWSCRVKLRVHLPPWWMKRSRSGSPSKFQAQERKQLCVLSRFRSVSRNADSPQNVRFMYMLYGSLFLFVSLVFKYSQNSRGSFPPDFAIFILWRQFLKKVSCSALVFLEQTFATCPNDNQAKKVFCLISQSLWCSTRFDYLGHFFFVLFICFIVLKNNISVIMASDRVFSAAALKLCNIILLNEMSTWLFFLSNVLCKKKLDCIKSSQQILLDVLVAQAKLCTMLK